MKLDFKQRPLSWSAISSFQYSPEQWYSKYVLNVPTKENMAMKFGKTFAKSCEERKPLAPVTLYKDVEYKLRVNFNGIDMIGFIDTYEPHTALREFKTSNKLWGQEKAQDHGQLKMYALMLYVQHKVEPDKLDIKLDCLLTKENGNFEVELADGVVHTYDVHLTMRDILNFGVYIMKTVDEMQKYVDRRQMGQCEHIFVEKSKYESECKFCKLTLCKL